MSMILEIPEQLEQKAQARALKSGERVEELLLRLLKTSLQQEMALEARIAGLPEAIVAEIRDLARQRARSRIRNPQSTIPNPQSAIRNTQDAIPTH